MIDELFFSCLSAGAAPPVERVRGALVQSTDVEVGTVDWTFGSVTTVGNTLFFFSIYNTGAPLSPRPEAVDGQPWALRTSLSSIGGTYGVNLWSLEVTEPGATYDLIPERTTDLVAFRAFEVSGLDNSASTLSNVSQGSGSQVPPSSFNDITDPYTCGIVWTMTFGYTGSPDFYSWMADPQGGVITIDLNDDIYSSDQSMDGGGGLDEPEACAVLSLALQTKLVE